MMQYECEHVNQMGFMSAVKIESSFCWSKGLNETELLRVIWDAFRAFSLTNRVFFQCFLNGKFINPLGIVLKLEAILSVP